MLGVARSRIIMALATIFITPLLYYVMMVEEVRSFESASVDVFFILIIANGLWYILTKGDTKE